MSGPELPDGHAALAGMSDRAVARSTGRSWPEWASLLDRVDASSLPHPEIAAHLANVHGLDGWWAQTVAVGYERLGGLREPGQRRDGSFDVNRSITVPVSVAELWRTVRDPSVRARWLPDLPLEESTATEARSIRWRVADGTRVEARFTEKGPEKSSVQFQHRGLPDRERADRLREEWGRWVAELKFLLS